MVLENMMGQLMSKDVLYEPLKELNDKVSGPVPMAPFLLTGSVCLSIVPILSVIERGQAFGI